MDVRESTSVGSRVIARPALNHEGSGVALEPRRSWLEHPRPRRARVALTVVLVAAAMPVRIGDSFPVVRSVSILDLLLLAAAATLYLDLAFRPLDLGYRALFGILCVPLVLSAVSLVWSQDRPATLRSTIIYAEGLVAYLFVVRELDGLTPARVISYIRRYAYLLIVPGVLLLLHVPGFQPEEPGLSHTSGTYLSYYTRLSHPVLGRSNNLATVLAFLAPLLLYWGHAQRDRRTTAAALVAVLAIFMTLSRGVLLAFVLGGLLYAPLAVGRRRSGRGGLSAKVLAVVALGIIAIAVFYSLNPATHEFFAGRLSLANVKDRSELIERSLSKIANRPVLGYGAGVVPDQDPRLGEGVHNTFVQQAVYLGIPLGALISLTLCALPAVFLARRTTPVAGVIAYILIVQLVLLLFESSFEGTVLRVLFYMSVGIVAALLRSIERGPPATMDAPP
jgi:O-antigen ligase